MPPAVAIVKRWPRRSRRFRAPSSLVQLGRSCGIAGLSAELAALGRSLMREADQHGWCERLRVECGWNDAMLARLLAQPRRTAARWQWLFATDGLRFDPWEHREYYEDSPGWKGMRAKWDRERAKDDRN